MAFEVQSWLHLLVLVVMLGVKVYALVSCLRYSPEAFHAAGKATKQGWAIGLGAGVAAQIILMSSPLNIIHLVFLIAALVYLADVRPALSAVMGRR